MAGVGGVNLRPGWLPEVTPPFIGPNSIAGLTGLQLWLDAENISGVAQGAQFTPWNDLSGQGNNFAQNTGANQPKFFTGGQNGHAFVRFDGATSYMTATVAAAAPCSIFAVAKLPLLPSGTSVVCSGNGASVIPILQVTTASAVQFGNGANVGAGTLPGTINIYTSVFNAIMPSIIGGDIAGSGGNGNAYLNTTTATAGSVSGNGGFASTMTIGAQNAGGANFCAMDLYELVIYTSQLTFAQRGSLFTYFAHKYNLGPVVTGVS